MYLSIAINNKCKVASKYLMKQLLISTILTTQWWLTNQLATDRTLRTLASTAVSSDNFRFLRHLFQQTQIVRGEAQFKSLTFTLPLASPSVLTTEFSAILAHTMKEIRWIQLYNYVNAKLESSRKFQLAMTVTLRYFKKRPAIVLKSRDDFKLVGHRSEYAQLFILIQRNHRYFTSHLRVLSWILAL